MTPEEMAELAALVRIDAVMRAKNRDAAREAAGCSGKAVFPDYVTAIAGVRHGRLQPYRCRYCGKWHVGASDAEPRRQLRLRARST